MKMHHICIQTNCYKKSLDFYTNILGFEMVSETKDFHTRDYNTWLKLGDFMIELQTGKVGETLSKYSKSSEGIVHFCLMADDLQKEYERIKNCGFTGFKPKNGRDIYTVEGGTLLKLFAPEGTVVELRDSEIREEVNA